MKNKGQAKEHVGINVTQSFQMHDVALSVFSFGNVNIISGSRKS